ncbi:hypothetical protein Mapa_010728 [Marchantia paleacea]|nr:hypothetical protein Mapa_010728 [Marchantia paleacea]
MDVDFSSSSVSRSRLLGSVRPEFVNERSLWPMTCDVGVYLEGPRAGTSLIIGNSDFV